jgi:hypothetical protein
VNVLFNAPSNPDTHAATRAFTPDRYVVTLSTGVTATPPENTHTSPSNRIKRGPNLAVSLSPPSLAPFGRIVARIGLASNPTIAVVRIVVVVPDMPPWFNFNEAPTAYSTQRSVAT